MTIRSRSLLNHVTVPGSYWRDSRAHRYSLLFALPLLLLYEGLAMVLSYSTGVRNGADVVIKSVFGMVAGRYGQLLFAAVVVGISVWLIGRDLQRSGRTPRPWVFGGMAAESVVLALLFGVVVGTITARVLSPFALVATPQPIDTLSWPTQLMVSLGAGIYEELLFRVVLVSGLAFLAQRVLKLRPWPAGVVAVVVGAFIFSAFHYIGPYGDPLQLQSFVYRMIGGMVFSAMYLLRGFGITAWTHALYDVFVLVI
jgi:hypothetical protein